MQAAEKPTLETIEAYLRTTLPAPDLAELEQLMQADAAVAHEVTLYRDIIQAVEHAGRAGSKLHFRQLEEKTRQPEPLHPPQNTLFTRINWRDIGRAAAMALTLGLAWWLTQRPSSRF